MSSWGFHSTSRRRRGEGHLGARLNLRARQRHVRDQDARERREASQLSRHASARTSPQHAAVYGARATQRTAQVTDTDRNVLLAVARRQGACSCAVLVGELIEAIHEAILDLLNTLLPVHALEVLNLAKSICAVPRFR
eukprot:3856426-Rhodomonas_salina.1